MYPEINWYLAAISQLTAYKDTYHLEDFKDFKSATTKEKVQRYIF
jgi:hypothetical protein